MRFEVPSENLELGDQVTLEIMPSTGFKATFWAYLLPFLLMLSVLVAGFLLRLSEELVGVMALLALLPYFLALAKYRKLLKSQMKLQVSKL